ncbi:type I secretion outer membrane protein, TolC family [Desulfacinum infernum DSM 9756]|uniref:Type I secretion outer membrane protein, TolC family n=1 Tax=Desulfacinum infernum DSM 9756 TaxID=1121391 RepID=A0A1M5DLC6_9BACT|nr:TolC family protein [Desulfacinum infernum]SHF67828.1 type I secretion outer membrane protein, TolC family [Desulfacinum infernum DSM 9756]
MRLRKNPPQRTAAGPMRTVASAALMAFLLFLSVPHQALGQTPSVNPPASHEVPAVLDLETAQRIALEWNPSLAAAAERVEQARQRIRRAWAGYSPRLEASAGLTHTKYPENATAGSALSGTGTGASSFSSLSAPEREDIYSATLTATWTLFDGFRREFALAAARFDRNRTEAALQEARRLLLAAVSSSFHGAQLALENVAIAEADEAFNQRQLEDARAREEAGAGSLSDVLNFQVQVNLARARKIEAERDYRVALSGLAALMGLPEGALGPGVRLAPLKEASPALLTPPKAEEEVAYALDHRPDVKAARMALLAARAGVGSARARFYPSLSLFGSLEGNRYGDAHLEEDDFASSVGVRMTVPLFSGGEDLASYREARHAEREADHALRNLLAEAASQVQSAVARVLAAQEQLRLQRRNARLVLQTRDLVQKEYTAGQASLVRLTQAQRDLVQAQSQLAQARHSLEDAWVQLDAATGKILER